MKVPRSSISFTERPNDVKVWVNAKGAGGFVQKHPSLRDPVKDDPVKDQDLSNFNVANDNVADTETNEADTELDD